MQRAGRGYAHHASLTGVGYTSSLICCSCYLQLTQTQHFSVLNCYTDKFAVMTFPPYEFHQYGKSHVVLISLCLQKSPFDSLVLSNPFQFPTQHFLQKCFTLIALQHLL